MVFDMSKLVRCLAFRANTISSQRFHRVSLLPFTPRPSSSSTIRNYHIADTTKHFNAIKASATALATSTAATTAMDKELEASSEPINIRMPARSSVDSSRMDRLYLGSHDSSGALSETHQSWNMEVAPSSFENDTAPGWKFRGLKNRSQGNNVFSSSVHNSNWSSLWTSDPLVWSSAPAASTGMMYTPFLNLEPSDSLHNTDGSNDNTTSSLFFTESSAFKRHTDRHGANNMDSCSLLGSAKKYTELETVWSLPYFMEQDYEQEECDENESTEILINSFASIAKPNAQDCSNAITSLRRKLERTEQESRLAIVRPPDSFLDRFENQNDESVLINTLSSNNVSSDQMVYGRNGTYSLW